MRIIRCDLHARQQTLAMLDTTTGEMVPGGGEQRLKEVRKKMKTLLTRPAPLARSSRRCERLFC
jgi:hypothetical protein